MKLNFFSGGSPLYPFRWFFVIALVIIGWIAYADYTGWRLFASSGRQQWNASGRQGAYHK